LEECPECIPGIQVDRGTETFEQIEKHLMHAIEFVEDRHYEKHWGFDNCLIPFLFTKEVRKNRAMQFIRKERGKCSFLLFQTIPDFGLLRHFPRPGHYDRSYQYIAGERSVRRYLDELEKANLLEVVQRGLGKTNLYRLHVVVQRKKS
jgi:hypothetical protein